MTRNELRLEFANANLPKMTETEDVSDHYELMPGIEWAKNDEFAGERGMYKDEYVEFLEDIVLNISRIVQGKSG